MLLDVDEKRVQNNLSRFIIEDLDDTHVFVGEKPYYYWTSFESPLKKILTDYFFFSCIYSSLSKELSQVEAIKEKINYILEVSKKEGKCLS